MSGRSPSSRSPNFKNSKSGAAAPDFEFLKFGESRYNDWVGGLGMGIVWGGGEDWEEGVGFGVRGLGMEHHLLPQMPVATFHPVYTTQTK